MKKTLLGAAAAAMTLTGFAASAAPYGGYGHRAHDQRSAWSHNVRSDSNSNRRGDHWRAGQYYSDYGRRDRMIDWRSRHLPRPRAGYAYYQEDNGDVVMAAIAGGLIGLVLGNALSN